MGYAKRLSWSDTEDCGVLDVLPTAVLIVAQGRVRYVNERAVAILGRPAEELLGHEMPAQLRNLGSGAPKLGLTRAEHVLRGERGDDRSIGFTRKALEDGSEVIVFQDISGFAKVREERDRLMRLAAIGEALPSLLHELKNPLAAVMTTVELLVEDVPQGETQLQLHAVLSELRRMALNFEGIGAVHRTLRSRRHGAVDNGCREACRVLAGRAKAAGIEFSWVIDDMPLLKIDPAVARALVFNFVTNAIHACNRGDAVRVEARLNRRGTAFELAVVDTGAGMAPEVLDRCRELFFTTKPSGSGIGLALCRRVVEEAGGRLNMKSVPGFGTLVTVRVPIERDAIQSGIRRR